MIEKGCISGTELFVGTQTVSSQSSLASYSMHMLGKFRPKNAGSLG